MKAFQSGAEIPELPNKLSLLSMAQMKMAVCMVFHVTGAIFATVKCRHVMIDTFGRRKNRDSVLSMYFNESPSKFRRFTRAGTGLLLAVTNRA